MDNSTIFSSFNEDVIEKVSALSTLLRGFSAHPLLKGNICMHGGTALNLFVLQPARMSLDIDLNYIASTERDRMLDERFAYIEAISDVARELGFTAHAGSLKHAGCTVKMEYSSSVSRRSDYVKVDFDFLNRSPLLKPEMRRMTVPGFDVDFLVNSPTEVVAGKIKAACSRVVPRDLFDLRRISQTEDIWTSGDSTLDHRIIFYNAVMSNRFPNHLPLSDRTRFEGRYDDFKENLLPVLPKDIASSLDYDCLLDEAIAALTSFTTPVDSAEERFAAEVSLGYFNPETLFYSYPEVLNRAQSDPVALHKVNNIRNGLSQGVIIPENPFQRIQAGNRKPSIREDIANVRNHPSNPGSLGGSRRRTR